MKLENLKVGDRIKYIIKNPICGTKSYAQDTIAEGEILEIRNDYGDFFQVENYNYGGNQISVKKKDIISKLEPQYKEIPIEKENKLNNQEIIDFSELKIGDTVNYKYVDATSPLGYRETSGKILEFKNEFVCVSGDSLTGSQYTIHMMLILEKLDYDYDNKKWNKTKVMWGTKPCKSKEYFQEQAERTQELINNKSAPKSFKFDISFVNRVEFNQSPYKPGEFPSCFFRIDGSYIKYYPNNPDIYFMNGKLYTIEIKEKE